jgi:phosphoribosylglycinamide formyltransferase-1
MKKIAIFGSGKGSNAANLIKHLKDNNKIEIAVVISNISDAGIIQIAKSNNIPSIHIGKQEIYKQPENVLDKLSEFKIDYIILAGYLLLVPELIISKYKDKIINIHPSLLPKYGGKGMYGMNVHNAVIDNNETQSGITIHIVNQEYDKGKILFQAICPICKNDTPESLAKKIHELEYKYFPKVVIDYITSTSSF